METAIFIVLPFLAVLLFVYAFNFQGTTIAIAKRLSPDYKLPPISFLDSLTRNGQVIKISSFLICLAFLFLSSCLSFIV